MKYIVKYEDVVIGSYIDDKDKEEYIVYNKGIEEIRSKGFDPLPMFCKSSKGKFPFFDNRIRNCKRFPGARIKYHTDPIELVEDK